MRMLSLFSGIEGIGLAAEWAGMKVVACCEINKFAQKVIKKHWPEVVIYDDVRSITRTELQKAGIKQIDILTGGFPCQPFSTAGERKGQEDERFLWPEMLRIVGETRPKWVLGENVEGLLSIADVSGKPGGTFGTILYDLAELGYRVGWACYGACEVGAPHERQRVFILAYSQFGRSQGGRKSRVDEKMLQKRLSAPTKTAIQIRSDLWSEAPSCILGVSDGLSNRVDRIKALGNAVVPQQIYPIFKAIMATEGTA